MRHIWSWAQLIFQCSGLAVTKLVLLGLWLVFTLNLRAHCQTQIVIEQSIQLFTFENVDGPDTDVHLILVDCCGLPGPPSGSAFFESGGKQLDTNGTYSLPTASDILLRAPTADGVMPVDSANSTSSFSFTAQAVSGGTDSLTGTINWIELTGSNANFSTLNGTLTASSATGQLATFFVPNGVYPISLVFDNYFPIAPIFMSPAGSGGNAHITSGMVVTSCTASLNVPILRQGIPPDGDSNPPWESEEYDSSALHIYNKGCALTSLAMALDFMGEATDPGLLNSFMLSDPLNQDFVGTQVNWEPTTRDYSADTLQFYSNRINSRDDSQAANNFLQKALCTLGVPVIVGVKLSTSDVPHHFVIVTGTDGSDYFLNDPSPVPRAKLSDYGDFETRGYVAQNGFVTNGAIAANTMDLSEFNVSVGDGVELLVSDPASNQTGFDSSSGNRLENIPHSVYFRDALDDDATGASATQTSHYVYISSPVKGSYSVSVVGLIQAGYNLVLGGFSQDGNAETSVDLSGSVSSGSLVSYGVSFDPSPGASLSITSTAGLSTSSLNFGTQSVRTSSAALEVTLSNLGTAALPVSAITVGGANGGDFTQKNTCGLSIAGGASCVIDVVFTPTSVGSRSGLVSVMIANGSVLTINLSGVGGTSFSLTASPSTNTITAGQSASYSLTIVPSGGFNQTVSLTCTGAPAGATCSISPASVALNGSSASTATATVTTVARSSTSAAFTSGSKGGKVLDPLYAVGFFLIAALRPARRRRLTVAILLLGTLAACGGGGSNRSSGPTGTQAGMYTLTLNGNGGGANQTTQVMLVVN